MKQVISDYERSILDAVACAAGDLRVAQQSLVTTIERLLLVDATETGQSALIAKYVFLMGADRPIEELLYVLGVAVHDPLAPQIAEP